MPENCLHSEVLYTDKLAHCLLLYITQHSPQGSAVCYECPEGHSCLFPDDDPVPCRLGEFSNSTNCLPCPRGFYCPDPTLEPVICPEGLYSDVTGAASCKICPVGHSCLDSSTTPSPCESGTYSLAGYISCMVSTNYTQRYNHGEVLRMWTTSLRTFSHTGYVIVAKYVALWTIEAYIYFGRGNLRGDVITWLCFFISAMSRGQL